MGFGRSDVRCCSSSASHSPLTAYILQRCGRFWFIMSVVVLLPRTRNLALIALNRSSGPAAQTLNVVLHAWQLHPPALLSRSRRSSSSSSRSSSRSSRSSSRSSSSSSMLAFPHQPEAQEPTLFIQLPRLGKLDLNQSCHKVSNMEAGRFKA